MMLEIQKVIGAMQAALDGKLSRLERRMQMVEATLHSVDKIDSDSI